MPDPRFNNLVHYGLNHDIFLAYSDDDGGSWSRPVRLNDDASSVSQLFPSVSVDRDGRVHVTFSDDREHPGAGSPDAYYVLVTDEGVSENVRVNPDGARALDGDYTDTVVGYPSIAYVSYGCPKERELRNRQGDGSVMITVWDACIAAVDPRLLPINHPPQLSPIGDMAVAVGETLRSVMKATDQDGAIPKLAATLAGGESLDVLVPFQKRLWRFCSRGHSTYIVPYPRTRQGENVLQPFWKRH